MERMTLENADATIVLGATDNTRALMGWTPCDSSYSSGRGVT